jgi:hypothetical protein
VLDDELMISLSKVIEIHSQQNVSMWKWKHLRNKTIITKANERQKITESFWTNCFIDNFFVNRRQLIEYTTWGSK